MFEPKVLFIGIILFLPFIHIQAQDSLSNSALHFKLEMSGFEKAEGEVRIAMFDSELKYKEKKEPVYAIILPVDSTYLEWEVSDLIPGEYAIAVYHDKNKNGKIDSNFLGIPKERYGFSNNARGRFGPASWSDAKFDVTEQQVVHQIHLK